MEADNENCILIPSDDDDDDGGGDLNASFKNGIVPKIHSSKTLVYSDTGTDSDFSGFGVKTSDRRLHDDLEIVEEVINNSMPGRVKKAKMMQCAMHYREKKMGFSYLKQRQQYPGMNSWALNSPDTFTDGLASDGDRKGPVSSDIKDEPTSGQKRRSFAAMRPSGSNLDYKRRKKLDISSADSPLSEPQVSKSSTPLDVTHEENDSQNSTKENPTSKVLILNPNISGKTADHANSQDSDKSDRCSTPGTVEASQEASDDEESNEPPCRITRGTTEKLKKANNHLESQDPLADDRCPSPALSEESDKEESEEENKKDTDEDDDEDEEIVTKSRSSDIVTKKGAQENNNSEEVPSKRISNIISNHDYGRLVWGKTGSSRPWPAVIVSYEQCGESRPPPDKAWLLWYADYRITQVPVTAIQDFVKNFSSKFVKVYNKDYNQAVYECLKECRERSGLEDLPTKNCYINWGQGGMTGSKNVFPTKDWCSTMIRKCLSRIRKMRTREKSSSEKSCFPTSSSSGDDLCAEERRHWKPKAALLKAVREKKQDIEKICIACDRVDCDVVAPHPYFIGGTCSDCKDELEDLSNFIADGTSMYCTVCSSPGELIVCDEDTCEKTFCTGCIELLVSPKVLQEIMDTDPWYCFLCEEYDKKTHGLLKARPDWAEKETASQSKDNEVKELPEIEDETPDISSFPQRPLRVLSLFDGIATGLYVLEKLGLEVEVYYASEILEPAKNVASLNFGSRITHIGDVQTVTDKQIAKMCPIDLLIGGSPCNDLSFVNPNRKGLFDPTGTGILFFHYLRALKEIKYHNRDTNTHLFWLFENVNHMPREFKTHINTFLQQEPWLVDSKNFSPQSRPRCFWGNIPGMYTALPPEILKKSFPLDDYVMKVGQRSALAKGVNCITTNTNSLKPIFKMNDSADYPWVTEIEKIFGFPAHYTDVGNLSFRERQALLGRSWSVGVIEYILKPLTRYFPSSKGKNSSQDGVSPAAKKKEEKRKK